MTYVYFIQADDGGPIKIGKAEDPQSRLGDLQVGCPKLLKLLAYRFECQRFSEARLHRVFRRFRVRGEWFEPCEPLLRLILAVSQREEDPLKVLKTFADTGCEREDLLALEVKHWKETALRYRRILHDASKKVETAFHSLDSERDDMTEAEFLSTPPSVE